MEENNVEKIDITQIIDRFYRTFIRYRFRFFLLIVICILLSLAKTYYFFDTTYSSKAVFIATEKEHDTGMFIQNDEKDELVTTFNSLVTGSMMQKIIMEEMDVDVFPGTISIKRIEDTNLIELKAIASNPQYAYDIVNCILNNYKQVTEMVMSDVSIAIMDTPKLAEAPDAYPNYIKSSLKGAALGIGLSCILILLISFIRHTILTPDDIKNQLHLKNLTKIPYVGRSKNKSNKLGLLLSNPRIQYSFRQAFHDIRLRLEQEHKEGKNVFMITSTLPDEGKSTISTNIAISLSQKGYKTILVDMDLRNPSIYHTLKSFGTKGSMVDYLKGRYKIEDVITHQEEIGLDVAFGSYSEQDSTELLSKERFHEFISKLRETYDFVILDAPPLYIMGDALQIGRVSDSALIVIKQDYANLYDVLESLEELNEYVPGITGTILNQYKPSIFTQEESKYGYGYGYGRK